MPGTNDFKRCYGRAGLALGGPGGVKHALYPIVPGVLISSFDPSLHLAIFPRAIGVQCDDLCLCELCALQIQ